MSDPCKDCGRCCSTQGTPPFTGCEGDDPPPELAWDIDKHADRYDLGLPCLWYDTETKRCKHYEHRPQVCRDFQPGEPQCNEWRVELGLPRLPDGEGE